MDWVSDSKLIKESGKKLDICTSRECIDSATILFQTVDFTQDPCQDFYKFACGNFAANHPINDNQQQNSWFVEKEYRLNRMILEILKSPIASTDLESVKQTKQFYQSCINKSKYKILSVFTSCNNFE